MYYCMNDIKGLLNINYSTMQKEFVRKSIHMTIATIPTFAAINKELTMSFLLLGITIYLISEYYRSKNIVLLGFVSRISEIASRDRDQGMTLGPVTLAFGTLVVLSLFNPVAATCGIYALAFGDGLSSVSGKLWGRHKVPFTNGKSYVGFFTCFTMILSTSYGVTGNLNKSLLAAVVGSVVELIPIKDIDNLLIPFFVALMIVL